ncbi:MAG: GIY-YIG nuclease family protein [Deltaproteobacteria bacterium]|nr:GIY-YIG nuclease family protein [Deltaproteobacteria bacterium]
MPKTYYVYIMTNTHNTTLYVGVTGDLRRRVYEHINGTAGGFTKKYNLKKLVHFEMTGDIQSAIAREKQLKGGSRQRKLVLIGSSNPDWRDLSDDL